MEYSAIFWSAALLGVIVYCIVKAVQDFRQRNYLMATLGLLSAIVILTVPIKTHAVKVTLPISDAS